MNDFLKVILFVLIGTVAMLFPMAFVAWRYRIRISKSVLVALYAAFCGTISTYFWFFVENHWIGGISFFGAVLLMPLFFLPAPKIFRESYKDLMDMFAPGICMMLAVMKVKCHISQCCGGRELCVGDALVRFPSQLAEMTNALILMVVLLLMNNTKNKGRLYPWYMVLYGCSRFVLQVFREEWVKDIGVRLPYSMIWSVLSVIIGIIWMKKMDTQVCSEEQNTVEMQ